MSDFRVKGIDYANQGKLKLAETYIKLAVEDGNPDAINDLGVVYERKGNYKKAFMCYSESFKKYGGVVSAYNMGNLLIKGLGVEKNLEDAFELISFAAREDYLPEIDKLSVMYFQGMGVEKNEEKGFLIAKRGAELELEKGLKPVCVNNVGYYYDCGLGVKQDAEKAFTYYNLAAMKKYGAGLYNVALCLLEGRGTKQDIEKGLDYMFESALNHYPDAFYRLYTYYKEGKYVEQDTNIAFRWLCKSVFYDSPRGILAMVEYYNDECDLSDEDIRIKALLPLAKYHEEFLEYDKDIERYENFKIKFPNIVDWDSFEENPYKYIETLTYRAYGFKA